MSEKKISYREGINFTVSSLPGNNTRLRFYESEIIKPQKLRVEIPAGHVCLLTSRTGALIHRWNGESRWLAKSLTDIFYQADNQCNLEFPEAGSYSFCLVEIQADTLRPHRAIHAGLEFLIDRVAAENSACLNFLPLVMDLEDRVMLDDLRFYEGKPVPAGLVDARCLLLFIRMLEKMIRLGLKDEAEWLPAYDQENLERAVAEISAEPGQKISIPELAKRYGLSAGRFKSLFRQQYGLTVHQFILRVRMDRASDLIIHTNLPVRDIADRLGYSNDSAFSTSFKKKTGSSPIGLRKRGTT